jgi:hypothetical protein
LHYKRAGGLGLRFTPLGFQGETILITVVFNAESGSFPPIPRENNLHIHRQALN